MRTTQHNTTQHNTTHRYEQWCCVLIIILFMMSPLFSYSQNQAIFSETWSNGGGEMAMFYKNATTTDDQRNVYVTGATLNSNKRSITSSGKSKVTRESERFGRAH